MSRNRTKRKQPASRAPKWRDIPDTISLANRRFHRMPSPQSLHPDHATIEAYVAGSPVARVITDAYRFTFPVTQVFA